MAAIIALALHCALLCTPLTAQEEEYPPLLADLAKLDLQVVHTEIAGELEMAGLGDFVRVSAPKGNVLVVVTLQGRAEEAWRVPLAADSFEAVYEEPLAHAPEDAGLHVAMRRSVGITTSSARRWLLKPERGNVTTTHHVREPGPVTIKAAFYIGDQVESFTVRVPTVAGGEAEVPQP